LCLVERVQVALDEPLVIRPVDAYTGLHDDARARAVVARQHRAEAGHAVLAARACQQDIAPGRDFQQAGAGYLEVAVENVAPGRHDGDVLSVFMNEQIVAWRRDGKTISAKGTTTADDIPPGHHADRAIPFIPGLTFMH